MNIDDVTNLPPTSVDLPAGVLDSATRGASALDVAANTPYGRNLLAHALVQLRRDGWISLPPADADQRHLEDEIEHPDFVEAVHHEFAAHCGECGQPLASESAG